MVVGRLVAMRVQQDPITPLVYELIDGTTQQTTVADVVIGAFGVVGVIGVGGLLLGVAFAGVLLTLKKMRGKDEISGEGSGSVRLHLNSTTE